ncbi:MAG: restriction endonuclease subunit S [Kiritimatiellia bacterium]|jgi:type I restriction enzyme S subunit|nr:restriction endonuclease subunit S [Kiritimatiellia bacterium]
MIPIGEVLELAPRELVGKRDLPVMSITMKVGLVDQAEKFKKRIASSDISTYKVVHSDNLVVGFPIDEGVLGFQRRYDAAAVSPAYDIWQVIGGCEVDRTYYEQILRSPSARAIYTAKMRGTTNRRRTIPKDIFRKIRLPLPPLAEQKRIAGILDAADALRAKRREAIAQLDAFIQSTFLDMFGDPVANPKGWERMKLGELINFIGGSQPPKDTFIYEPKEDYVRLVQIRDFKTDKYQTFIPKKLAKRPFYKDDVMIARYGPPVFQILTGLSGSYNVALMKAEPIGNVEKHFIFYLLSSPVLNAAVVAQSERTAGQSGVNLSFLNNYMAYIPPTDLQRRFAAIVESIEAQKARHRMHLAELDTLFASLQQRAFSGELTA